MKQVVLENISVSLPPHNDKDALTIKDVRQQAVASILMDRCTVRGGSECVFIDTYGVHLRGCHISGAENRGIFANNDFVIEDSVVKGCGGYGMKTRAGCERRGKNTNGSCGRGFRIWCVALWYYIWRVDSWRV